MQTCPRRGGNLRRVTPRSFSNVARPFEYHLYTLERPTTLLTNEQKQVSLLEAQGIKVDKKLIFFDASQYYRSSYGEITSTKKSVCIWISKTKNPITWACRSLKERCAYTKPRRAEPSNSSVKTPSITRLAKNAFASKWVKR